MQFTLPLRRLQCLAFLLGGALLAVPSGSAAVNADLDLITGEPFLLGAETHAPEPLYSWVLSKDGQIVETQAEKFFRMNPLQAGTMELALTIRSSDGAAEEKHSFPVRIVPKVEVDPAESNVVRAVIRTEPPAGGPEKTVTLPLEGGIMTLFLDESTGNIREYRVDSNIAFDTDGDGVTENDADNSVHPSFTAGGSFPMSIVPAPGERERIVQLRVLGMNGELSETRIRVLFDPNSVLTPALRTLPPMESNDVIRLPAEGGVVRFDAILSGGGASRYAIDLDHAADTDSDGNPANDNDFRGTPFELSGTEVRMLLLPNAGASQRRISLTVSNASGETGTHAFILIFGDGMSVPSLPQPEPSAGPTLNADRDLLSVGSSFTLRVDNAPLQTVRYAWDLQSDGISDTETGEPSLLLEPDAPGILPVRVLLKDTNGGTVATVSREFTVRAEGREGSPEGTVPLPVGEDSLRIDTVTEELIVTFQPLLRDGGDFSGFYPTWDFGDGSKSYLLAPVHSYAASGTYEVKLTFTDPASGREAASAVTAVSVEGAPATAPAANAGFFAGFLRTLGFILKVILFVLFLLLLFTGGVLAYAFLQAKAENVPLKDVLLSYKRRISGETEPENMAKSVPEIIEAASAKKKESDEPAPMKLVAEEVPKKAPPPPPQAPRAPVKAPENSAPATEKGQLPPWLQTEEKPSKPPRSTPAQSVPPPSTPAAPVVPKSPMPPPPVRTPPPPPAKPATPPVPSPVPPPVQPKQPAPSFPAKTEEMPAWLKQGMEKTATPPAPKPVVPPAPLPLKPVTTPAALPVPPVQQALPPPSPRPPVPLEDDEPIAMLRAELPEEEDQGAPPASEQPIPKEQK